MYIKRKIHNFLHPKLGEVWMLHRVVEQRSTDPEQRWLEVTPDWLEQKILEYKSKGYSFLSLDRLPSNFNSQFSIFNSHRWVCITLDDGYADYISLALPLFRKLEVPFAVYLTTGFIDNQIPMWWYNGQHLGPTANQVRQLATDPLCTLGAHTVSHPHLSQLSATEQRNEIESSMRQLEAITNCPIKHFSYPHGDYNHTTLDICQSLGFLTAVTTSGRAVRTNTKALEIDRIAIVQPN